MKNKRKGARRDAWRESETRNVTKPGRIWLDSGGTLTARQVAEQVGVKPEQVRKWKSLVAGRRT